MQALCPPDKTDSTWFCEFAAPPRPSSRRCYHRRHEPPRVAAADRRAERQLDAAKKLSEVLRAAGISACEGGARVTRNGAGRANEPVEPRAGDKHTVVLTPCPEVEPFCRPPTQLLGDRQNRSKILQATPTGISVVHKPLIFRKRMFRSGLLSLRQFCQSGHSFSCARRRPERRETRALAAILPNHGPLPGTPIWGRFWSLSATFSETTEPRPFWYGC
jgi:hypothetical protein